MYQYKNGKPRNITMNVGTEFIIDWKHNNKLVKLNKIEAIHLGKASKGLRKVTSPHDVCFSIIKKKTFGRETLDFETKRQSHRTCVIFKIIENMQSFGLGAEKVEVIKSMVLSNENQDEILVIALDQQTIAALSANVANETAIEMETTEWIVSWHKDGKRADIVMVIDSKAIFDGNTDTNILNLIEIQEIQLWNGTDEFQDVNSPKNVSFSIIQYSEETGCESIGFEMRSAEDRSAIIIDILDKLKYLGVYPVAEDGLTRQIVLDSMALEETFKIRVMHYADGPPEAMTAINQNADESDDSEDIEKGFTSSESTRVVTESNLESTAESTAKSQEIRSLSHDNDENPETEDLVSVREDHLEDPYEIINYENIDMIRIYDHKEIHILGIRTSSGMKHRIKLGKKKSRDKIAVKLITEMDTFGKTPIDDDVDSLKEQIRNLQTGDILKIKLETRTSLQVDSESDVDDDTRKLLEELLVKNELYMKKLKDEQDERRATEMENQKLRQQLIAKMQKSQTLQNEIDVPGDLNSEIQRLTSVEEGQILKRANADLSEKFQKLGRDLDRKISGNDGQKQRLPSDSKSTENKELTMYLFQHKNGKKGMIAMNIGSNFIIDSEHNNKLVKLNKIEMIHLGKASKGLQKVTGPHNVYFSITQRKRVGRETLHFEVRKASHRTDVLFQIMENMQSFGLSAKALAVMKSKVLSNQKQDEILEISLDPQTIAVLTVHVMNDTASKMETTAWKVCGHKRGKRQQIVMVVDSEAIIDGRTETKILNLIEIQEIHLWNGTDGFQDVNSPKNVSFCIMQYSGKTGWNSLGFEMSTTEDRTAIIMDILDKLQYLGIYPIVEEGLTRQIVLDKMGTEETFQIRVMYYADISPEEMDRIIRQTVEMEKGLRSHSCTESVEGWEQPAVSEEKYSGMDLKSNVDDTRKLVKLLEDLKAKDGKQRESFEQQSPPEAMVPIIRQSMEIEKGLSFGNGTESMEQLAVSKKKYTGIDFKSDVDDNRKSVKLLDELKAKNEKLRKELTAERQKSEILQNEMDDYRGDTIPVEIDPELPQAHDSTVVDVKKQSNVTKGSINWKQLAVAVSKEKYHEMKRRNEAQMTANQDLKNELASLQEKFKKYANDTGKILEELKAKNEKQREDLDERNEAIQKLQDEQVERGELEKKQNELMQQLAATDNKCLEMQQKYDSERKGNQELRAQMFTEGEKAEARIHGMEQLMSNVKETLFKLKDQKAENEAQRKDIDQQLNRTLSEKIKEHENLKKQMDALQQETSADIEQLRIELREERSKHKMELDQFQEESMKKAKEHRLKYEELEVKQKELVQQLAATEKKYHEIEGKYEAEQKVNEEQRKEIISDHEGTAVIIERLHSDLDSLRSELKEQREQNEAQQQQLTEERAQNELYLRKRVVMELKLVDEMQKSETLQKAMSDLRDELTSHRTEIDRILGDSKKELIDKIEINANLKNELDTLREKSSAKIEHLRNTVDYNEMEIENIIEKMDELQDSILAKDAELIKHREDLDRESGANEKLQEKEALVQKENQELKQKLSVEKAKSEALQTKMDLHQEEMDKEIQRLKSDLDYSRRELSDRQIEDIIVQEELVMNHKESIEMKEAAISEIEEKNNKFEAVVAAKAEAIKTLESDLLGMEKMNSQLTKENARKEEALKSQLVMMKETKAEFTESLKQQTAEFMQMKLELAASRQELADKNTDIERLHTVHDEMRADLEKLNQTNSELQNSSSAVSAELVAEKELVVKQQAEYEELRLKQKALMQKLADTEKQYDEMEHKYEEEMKAHRVLQEEMVRNDEAVMMELEGLKFDLNEQRAENETVQQEINQQFQIHQQLQQQLVIVKKEKEQLDQEWTDKTNIQRQETLSEIQKLKCALDSNQIEFDNLKERNRTSIARVLKQQMTIHDLSEKNRELQESTTVMKAELLAQKKMVVDIQEDLMQQISAAKKEYAEIKEKFDAEKKENEDRKRQMVLDDEKAAAKMEQFKADLQAARSELKGQKVRNDRDGAAITKLENERETMEKKEKELQYRLEDEIEKNQALRHQMDADQEKNDSEFQQLESNLSKLRVELKATKERYYDLTDKNRELQDSLSTKNEIFAEQNKLVVQQGVEYEQLEVKQKELMQQLADTEEKYHEMKHKFEEQMNAYQKLREQIISEHQETAASIARLNSEQEIREKENYELQQKWTAEMKKNQMLSDDMNVHLEKTDSKVKALESDLDDHRRNLKEERARCELYLHEREVSEGENHKLQEKLAAEKERYHEIEAKYQRQSGQIVTARRETETILVELNSVLDVAHSKLEEQGDAHRQDLEQRAEAHALLVNEYEKVKNELAIMEKDKEHLRQEWIAEIESMDKLADTRRLETDSAIQCLKSNLDELRGELTSQRMEMNQYQQDAARIVEQFERELTSKMKENNDLKNQMDVLLQEHSSKIEKFGQVRSTLDAKQIEIHNLNEINGDLKDSVLTKDSALTELQTELEREREIISKMEDELISTKKENDKLQQQLSTDKEENEALKRQVEADREGAVSEIEHLKSDLVKLKEELIAHQMEMDKAQTEATRNVVALKAVNADLSGKVSDKMKESDFLKLQMDTVQKASSSEIEWLRSTLNANNVTINNLTDKNRELQDSLSTKNEIFLEQNKLVVQQGVEYEQLEVKQKELMQQLADTEEKYHEMKHKFEEQMNAYQKLRDQILSEHQETAASIARLNSEQEIREKENYELEQKWSAEIKKNRMLSDEMNVHLEETDSKVKGLESDLDDHRRNLKEQRAQCELYLHEREVSEGEKHKLQERLAAEIEVGEALRNTTRDLREELTSCKGEMDHLREDTSEEIEQLRSTLDANGVEIASLIERIGELQDSISEKVAELARQREDLQGESSTNEELLEKKAMVEQENQELKRTVSIEIEKSEALRSQINLHRREADEQIQRLKSALDDSRRELTERQVEMQEVQENFLMKHRDSLGEIKGNIGELQQLVATRGATIEKLESDLSRMEKMNGELTEDNDRNREALKRQLARTENEIEELNDLLRTKIGKIQQLKSEVDDSRRELTNKISDIRLLWGALKKLKRNVDDLDERNHELQDSSSALSAAIAKVQSERETMEKKESELQYRLDDEIDKYQALRNQMDADREKNDLEIQHLESNLNKLRVELTATKERYHEIVPKYRRQSEQVVTARQETETILVRLNSDLDVAHSKLEEQKEAQRQELDQRAEAHALLLHEYEIVKKENNDLNQSNNQLKAAISEINNELLLQNKMMMKQRAASEQLNKKQKQLILNELLAEHEQAMLKKQNDEEHDGYRKEADSEIQRLKSALDASQEELAASQRRINETKEKLEELQQQGAKHELLMQRVVISTEIYTEMKKQYDAVMEINQDLRNHIANDREATKQKFEKLKFDLHAARKEMEELRAVSEAQQVVLDQQSEVNKQLQRELEIMDEKEPLILSETDRLKEQVQLQEQAEIVRDAQLNQKMSVLSQESAALQGDMALYRGEVDSQIKRLDFDLNDARNALELKRTHIEGQRRALDQQSQVHEEVLAVKVMMKKENRRLYKDLRSEQEKKIVLQNQMDVHREKAESQTERLQYELSDSRREITAHQMEMDHLERTVNEVKVRMNPRCKNM